MPLVRYKQRQEKQMSAGHRGQLESLSSPRFRCCLPCIVRRPPVSPKDTYLWRCTLSTDTVTTYTAPPHKETFTDEHNPPLDVLLSGYESK